MWQPTATLSSLRKRAEMIHSIRHFFHEREVLEVETPVMAAHGVTDVYLANFSVQDNQRHCYLQTSPEFHMKRLLAAGSGSIYQMSKAFRQDEQGRHHNREFTLLEWYRLGYDHHQLMDEVDELLQLILATDTAIKVTYQSLFEKYCSINPLATSQAQLVQVVNKHGYGEVLASDTSDPNQYLHLLMSMVIEPQLAKYQQPVIVYDFPISQAALAKCRGSVACRFEVYYRGLELANGFDELQDAGEQLQRFNEDNTMSQAQGLPMQTIDPYLLQALEHGLPQCSGVALGIDRLLMLALKKMTISDVLSFDSTNA